MILVTCKNTSRRETENIFVEFLLPKTKPQIVGIIYRPPNQSNFLEIITTNFDKLDTDMKESNYLGDFNISMCQNNKDIVCDDTPFFSKFLFTSINQYQHSCTMHILKHLIKSLALVTCSSSSLIDHIVASFPSRVSRKVSLTQGYLIINLFSVQKKICN